jgi:hypothetical protein
LNWENTDMQWIEPKEFNKFKCIPVFEELLEAVGLV